MNNAADTTRELLGFFENFEANEGREPTLTEVLSETHLDEETVTTWWNEWMEIPA